MNYNPNTPINPKTVLRITRIIHLALLIGPLLYGFLTFSIANNASLKLQANGDVFFYIVPGFIVATGLIGIFLYKKTIAVAANAATLKEKAAGYQTSLIVRYALSEGSTLLAVTVFTITANFLYLVFAGLNMLYFLSLMPTAQKMTDELNLNYEDKAALGI
jgi:hypothetical protein